MRALLACSGGGHLKQLVFLLRRLPAIESATWVTFDTGLSRALLAEAATRGDEVVFAPYAAPRDVRNLLRSTGIAARLLRRDRFDIALSTGAGIALAVLPAARATGVPAHYIESATRGAGPSLTGRVLQWVPGISLHTQHAAWASSRWRYAGSVFDAFEGVPSGSPPHRVRRVVVSLGTTESYGFRRLVERILEILPSDAEVLWQTGATDVRGLPVDGRVTVPADDLRAAMADADVVISHAGTGSALTAFELGLCPVLVPRERCHGEHVDDHQVTTAAGLATRQLAISARVSELTEDHLLRAAARRVRQLDRPPSLDLATR